MIKAKYRNELQKIWDKLETMKWDMDMEKDAIEEKASDRDREMTDAEQEKWDEYDDAIESIDGIMDELSELFE